MFNQLRPLIKFSHKSLPIFLVINNYNDFLHGNLSPNEKLLRLHCQ